MVVVLDEAANICRIADLPQLYSHLGSRGVIPLTILQSHAQGVGVWGETGMKALLGAATVKLVGSGIDDASFAEDLSRLIGDHDVTTVSTSTGDGRSSRSRSVRQQRILPAAAIRSLPKGQALVWLTGSKVALVTTLPWYTGPAPPRSAPECRRPAAHDRCRRRHRADRRSPERSPAVKGANEFAALKAKVELLQTEVTVLGSVLEDLHYATRRCSAHKDHRPRPQLDPAHRDPPHPAHPARPATTWRKSRSCRSSVVAGVRRRALRARLRPQHQPDRALVRQLVGPRRGDLPARGAVADLGAVSARAAAGDRVVAA
jgi:hypothetical protein